jgi:hypothetical protein
VLRNIANAEASLKNKQYQLVADHLGVAKWNVEQVKKAITLVGQSKTKSPAVKLTSWIGGVPHPVCSYWRYSRRDLAGESFRVFSKFSLGVISPGV